jgi:hypothetical protein
VKDEVQMKRHVEEIASDARTLVEKLNSLSDQFALETIVWANGRLFVVVRESAVPDRAIGAHSKAEEARKPQCFSNRERKLRKPGQRMRKDVQ